MQDAQFPDAGFRTQEKPAQAPLDRERCAPLVKVNCHERLPEVIEERFQVGQLRRQIRIVDGGPCRRIRGRQCAHAQLVRHDLHGLRKIEGAEVLHAGNAYHSLAPSQFVIIKARTLVAEKQRDLTSRRGMRAGTGRCRAWIEFLHDYAPATRAQTQRQCASRESVVEIRMNGRRLEHSIGPGGERRGIRIRETTRCHQRHSSQAHRPQRTRRGANVSRMLRTHQDAQHVCLHDVHDRITARTRRRWHNARAEPAATPFFTVANLPMPRPAITVAVRAARAAGNVILRYQNRVEGLAIVEKQRMDFASEVDRLAEAEIIREVRRSYPDHGILAEESGQIGKGRSTWVIDPLDGTHNYLRGIPHCCVSIALVERGEPTHGVVFDPFRNELFTASKGDGAFLNDRRIRVSKREGLEGAMIATGFPFRQRPHLDVQLGMVRALLAEAEDLRRSGSAALDLAYVASARFDGYFEIGLKPWDLAAGCLLVREAGGRYSDFAGREGLPASGNIVAGNLGVTKGMLATIGPLAPPSLLQA